MQATVGDTFKIRGVHQGNAERCGTILEIHGKDGEPPYLVRWRDGQETLFFPSADIAVEHHLAGGQPTAP